MNFVTVNVCYAVCKSRHANANVTGQSLHFSSTVESLTLKFQSLLTTLVFNFLHAKTTQYTFEYFDRLF